jgi:hypothetical protein
MALYMVQFAYTAEAWTAFTKHPEDRTAAVTALAEKLGCRRIRLRSNSTWSPSRD